MKHPERVDDYLGHIIEAIERVTAYIAPLQTLDALQQDQKTQDAIVRNIQIIGEAVSKIQKSFLSSSTSIVTFPGRKCEPCATW